MTSISPMNRAVVVLSGGQDSTTCLYWARQRFAEIHAVSFDYGQRHRIELEAAKKIAAIGRANTHHIIDIPGVLDGSSPLVSSRVLEQYSDADNLPGGIEKTFVPCRNQLFLTIAANQAHCLKARNLVTGVCQEDYGGYPDCRQVFIDALELALNLGTFTGEEGTLGNIEIHTPLMNLTKAASVDLALAVGAYKALAWTHTAYDGQYPPTGNDHASLLRERGFREAGLPDPLVVRAVKEEWMEYPDTVNYRSVNNDITPAMSLDETLDWALQNRCSSHV